MDYKKKIKESFNLLEEQKDCAEHFHNKQIAEMERHIGCVRELVEERKKLLKEKGDKWYYYEFLAKEGIKPISELMKERLIGAFGEV